MKSKKTTNDQLAALLKKHRLNRAGAADVMCVVTSTVDRWLQPRTLYGKKNPTFREMPEQALELLKRVVNDPIFIAHRKKLGS